MYLVHLSIMDGYLHLCLLLKVVGILLLTHAPLGRAFIEAATHVFRAAPERVEALDMIADQNPDEVRRLAHEAIARALEIGLGRDQLGRGLLLLGAARGDLGRQSDCLWSCRSRRRVRDRRDWFR